MAEKAINKYRELYDKKRNIKREYGRNRYQNMSKKANERLKKYQKNYLEEKNY